MTRNSELNTSPCIRCLTDKVKCYKKSRGPGCYRCYMKKGACSLAQGRRVKEDDENGLFGEVVYHYQDSGIRFVRGWRELFNEIH